MPYFRYKEAIFGNQILETRGVVELYFSIHNNFFLMKNKGIRTRYLADK